MNEGEAIPAGWFTRIVYFTGIEHDPLWPADNDPGAWQSLKDRMEPDDFIWWFSTPSDLWVNLAGRMGYALVRDGKVMASVVTMMN